MVMHHNPAIPVLLLSCNTKQERTMKTISVLLVAAGVLALSISEIKAQSFSVKTYKLSVQGTSSLHDWESSVEQLQVKGSVIIEENMLSDIRDIVVKIPVKAIKSTKGKVMDNKTWEAFNYEKNPTITFVLTGKKIEAGKNRLIANGTLTMAGVARHVELDLHYKILPRGEIQITGTHKLRMSDFKMDPPTAMMGTIKVGNEVVVILDVTLNINNTLSSK